MNFASKTSHESLTMPGVSFQLKKLSHARRVKLDLALAVHRERIRTLLGEYSSIRDDKGLEADLRKAKLNEEYELVLAEHHKPTYVRMALESITGLTIDDVEVKDAGTLIDEGPDTLVEEIYNAIAQGIDPSEDGIKN